jgi:hypothetical protein
MQVPANGNRAGDGFRGPGRTASKAVVYTGWPAAAARTTGGTRPR